MLVGGTSASAPVFAGIVALLNNYLVSKGEITTPGLGDINPLLYSLAGSTSDVFHSITQGNNIVPCTVGTTDCTTGSLGYSTAAGYNEVTGLGSVDAYNLLQSWNSASLTGTSLTLATPNDSIAVGSSVTFTATVKAASGSALREGALTFYANTTVVGSATLNQDGVASLTVRFLNAGSNAIQAKYSGSLEYGQSLSQTRSEDVVYAMTTALMTSSGQTGQGGEVTLTATVAGSNQTPTGTVTFYNGCTLRGFATLSNSAASLTVTALPVGTDSITAAYSGSATFSASTSPAVSVTVAAAPAIATTITLAVSSSQGTMGSSLKVCGTVTPASGTTVPSGSVAIYDTSTLGKGQIAALPLTDGAYIGRDLPHSE